MELIRGLHNLRDQHRGCVATIGNFDGVHLGHLRVLHQVKEQSAALGLPSVVIVFEPQPREFFRPEAAPPRLTSLREKLSLLRAQQIDRVFCLRFNETLRALSAEAFIDQLLLNGLAVKYFVVGDDFRFGCDRRGNFELLQQAGRRHGFTVSNTQTFDVAGERVSSTRIRRVLADHDFALAERLLGRPYSISGRVGHGRKLGRQLGVPTANLRLARLRPPLQGVFAVRVHIVGGDCHTGVANLGIRPSVDGEQPQLEVHLFDFNRDLYGQRLEVQFCHFIRTEQRFASLEELKRQIEQDMQQAQALLDRAGPASPG